MITDRVVGELRQIKLDIQKWLTPDCDSSDNDVSQQANRNAEELIWKLQKRYGYFQDKQNLEQ